jgi:hypothetical protein
MRVFELYDPRQPLPQQQLLKAFVSPLEKNGGDFYFVKDGNHLIAYRERLHIYPPTSTLHGQKDLIADQLEMPISGVRWFINAIDEKFFKPAEEGGLPGNKISFEETVGGEDLHIIRSTHAGCEHPGYTLTNASRRSHILSSQLQGLSLSDPWLFQGGLMDFFKGVADKYEHGEL